MGCLAGGKSMPKEQRFFTLSPNGLSCSLCPSRGKTVGSGPFLGFVAFTFLFHAPLIRSVVVLWVSLPLCVILPYFSIYVHCYFRMLLNKKFNSLPIYGLKRFWVYKSDILCLFCRGWLIRGSRSLLRCSGSSRKRRWTHLQSRHQRERKSMNALPNFSRPLGFRSATDTIPLVYCHIYWGENYNISFLIQVFKGYVDDPRNTDNAWMETVAVNFHDDSGINS